MHVLPSSSNHRAQPSFHVSLLGTFYHWLLSIKVAISLLGACFQKRLDVVVQVALSTLKDDHQSRKRPLLRIQDDGCWWIGSAER